MPSAVAKPQRSSSAQAQPPQLNNSIVISVRKSAPSYRLITWWQYRSSSLSCRAVKMAACSGVAKSDGSALHGDLQMNVQVIERDGHPEYAVLPWAQYQALLQAGGRACEVATVEVDANEPALSQLVTLREAKGLSAEQL